MGRYILAVDQGTTSSRAIIFDKSMRVVSTAQKEFTQYFPGPGWVEHNSELCRSEERRVGKECRSRWSPYH